jgi:NADH-quinone oxidoreductase subunit N
MNPGRYLELLELAAPETVLVVTLLAVLGADGFGMRGLERRTRRMIGGMISCLGCALAIAWMVGLPREADSFAGLLVVDPLTRLVKIGLLVLTVFTLLVAIECDFTDHIGEYFALVLLATVGMMFLVSSEDILMIFLSLELTSLSLYILTAFNTRNPRSAEAALKYFLFGSVSAAIMLFGLSLLYGLAGATQLARIAAAIHGPVLDPLLLLALVMTVVGLGFKVAVAPFHLWAPDVYQGAPTPSAAFIASGSKVAGFFIFAKVMLLGFKGAEGSAVLGAHQPGWLALLALLAAVSMILGNLLAIVQKSVRRLLAYSAIAHAGYLLLGVMSPNSAGLTSLVYYVFTYALTTLGMFGVVSIVENRTGGDALSDFAGLSRRAPVLSCCTMVLLLSLAGIPPLAGFFGKFYLFAAVLGSTRPALGLLWLVALALAASAVSLYYYLQVLKQIYLCDPPAEARPSQPAPLTLAAVVLLALAVMGLGCAPAWFLEQTALAIQAAGL